MYIALPVHMLPEILAVYVAAALLPAVVLLVYVYRHDAVEKEPPGLLALLLLWGMAAAVCSAVAEKFGVRLLGLFLPKNSVLYKIILAFLVVAVVEEGFKFFFLRRATWNHPAFNYRFDGIVYAVFVSLGFAALENVRYVLVYGLGTAVARAFQAVPGHMAFAVFMGLWYGRARLCGNRGEYGASRLRLWAGYAAAVFLHGVYDVCALMGTLRSTAVFVIFVGVMFFAAYRSLKREAASDVQVT